MGRRRALLRKIDRLRTTAFLQPPHWDHEPTTEELRIEEEARLESKRAYRTLKAAVRELSDLLMDPFER